MSDDLDHFAATILQELPGQVLTNLSKINEINTKVQTLERRTDRLIDEFFSPDFPEDRRSERRAYIDSLLAKIRRYNNQKVRLSAENFNAAEHCTSRLDTHLNKFQLEISFRALTIANAPDHQAESTKWLEWDKNKGESPTKKITKRELIKKICSSKSKKRKIGNYARTGKDIKSSKRNGKKRIKNTTCPTNEAEDKETISKKQLQESPQPSTSKCDDESNERFKSPTEIRQISCGSSKSKKIISKDANKRKKGSALCSSSDEGARKSMLKKKKQRQGSISTNASKTDQEPSTSSSCNKISNSNKKKKSVKNINSRKDSNTNTKDTGTKELEKKESKSEQSPKRTGQDEEAITEEFNIPIDPNEPVYCTCQRVSFGQMVACDDEKCSIEWFHFECVGLSASPDGEWYCEECSEKRKKTVN